MFATSLPEAEEMPANLLLPPSLNEGRETALGLSKGTAAQGGRFRKALHTVIESSWVGWKGLAVFDTFQK